MDKYIFLCVIPVDESIAALHVEPFHGTGYFLRDHFFFDLSFIDRLFLRLFLGVRHGKMLQCRFDGEDGVGHWTSALILCSLS
ncbi:hypothetical protein MQA28_25900, partial [Escherichia coli]|nr:hypothetical protein [Escherichia coli]